MASLNGHFSLFKQRIEPDAERVKKAQSFPAQVREHLKKHEEFATEHPHTRLAGSYPRHTATKQIKDVDILVFAHQSWREKSVADLLEGLYAALKDLPNTLGEGLVQDLRRQRRSVNIYLPDSDLSLDIVPVLTIPDDPYGTLEIPDRQWDELLFTNPLGYADLLSGINGDNGGDVVPLVKMLKHWRDVHFQRMKPKSYWLESMVVHHVRREWLTVTGKGCGEMFADLLDSIYSRLLPVLEEMEESTPFIPDAMLRNPVAWNWKRSHFESFMNRLDASRKKARRAVATTDSDEAVTLWKAVFGDEWFPSTEEVEEAQKSIVTAHQECRSGSCPIYITTGLSAGQVFLDKPQERSVESLPHRFYGGK